MQRTASVPFFLRSASVDLWIGSVGVKKNCSAKFLDLRNGHDGQDQHSERDEHGVHCPEVGVVHWQMPYPATHDAYALDHHGYGTKYEYAHHTGKEATEPLE